MTMLVIIMTAVVKLFSRHLLDQTQQYPDVASSFLESAALAAQRHYPQQVDKKSIHLFVMLTLWLLLQTSRMTIYRRRSRRQHHFDFCPFKN
jgi:hypothetical protein